MSHECITNIVDIEMCRASTLVHQETHTFSECLLELKY